MNVPLEKYCTMVWDCGQRDVVTLVIIVHPNAVLEQMDLDFAPALKEVWSKYLR
jgi:hypothetical protein